MYSDEERRIITMQKRSKRLVQFGYTDITLVVGCCVKFIDSDATLVNVLLLSSDTNEILQSEILKQALLRSNQDRLKAKRITLWTKLLKIDEKTYRGDFELNKEKS